MFTRCLDVFTIKQNTGFPLKFSKKKKKNTEKKERVKNETSTNFFGQTNNSIIYDSVT